MDRDYLMVHNQLLNDGNFFKTLLATIQEGVCVLNPDMTVRYANKFLQDFYKKNAPIEGKKCFQVYHNRTAPCNPCPTMRCMNSGKLEKDIVSGLPDSTVELVELSAYPMKNSDTGEITGVVEIVRDITAQKQQENKLAEERRQIELILDITRTGIDIIDAEFNLRFVDKGWQKIYGDPTGRKCYDYFMGLDKPCPTCSIPEAIKSKKTVIAEEVLPRENNRIVLVYTIPFQDKNGEWLVSEFNVDITDRKKTEDALRESEQKFSSILKSIQDVVWSFSLKDGELIYMSPSVEQMLGRKPEEFSRDKNLWIKCAHPEDIVVVIEKRYRELEKKGFSEEEHRIVRKDGSIGWIRNRVKLAYDENGEPERVDGLFTDITEQKKKEEELKASEGRFKSLATSSKDAVLIADESGKIVYCNSAAETITGYTTDELLGKSSLLLRPPRLRDVQAKKLEKYILEGKFENRFLESSLVRKSGEEFPVEVSTTSWKQGGKTFFGGFIRDITERKQAEEALRRSEAKVSSILNSLEDVVMSFSIEAEELIYLSPSAEKLFGRKVEDFKENKQLWMEYIHPDDINIIEDGYNQLGEKGLSETEYRIIRPDGDIKWVRDRVKIIYDEKGEPVFMNGLASDITERKKAEEERLEMERRLLHSQKLESLGILAGGIAHDFNNLLLAVIGNLDMSLRKLSPVSEARCRIENAMKAAHRAADLTRQMLAYSGKGHFVVTDININELINENLYMLESTFSKNVNMHLNLADDIPGISADTGQIQQVVMNFITNASEAIGEEHGSINISTGVMDCNDDYLKNSFTEEKPPAGRYVYLEVTDNGCGMDEETIEKIFDPFFTTKFTGRGLGMAAVIGIVRGHNGAVFVESALGKGTTIRVLFPVSKRAGQEKIEKDNDTASEKSDIANGKSEKTVLIVDDERMVLEMCDEMVTDFGYKTVKAENGEVAVEIFKERYNTIDCIILDLSMPKMDGYDTFIELKKINPDVKVILSSGYDIEEATERFEGQGLSGFIHKPYMLDALEKEIERVICGEK